VNNNRVVSTFFLLVNEKLEQGAPLVTR
jgi:hypothetical protein